MELTVCALLDSVVTTAVKVRLLTYYTVHGVLWKRAETLKPVTVASRVMVIMVSVVV